MDDPHTGLPLHTQRKLKVVERHLYDQAKLAPVHSLTRELSSPVTFQDVGSSYHGMIRIRDTMLVLALMGGTD